MFDIVYLYTIKLPFGAHNKDNVKIMIYVLGAFFLYLRWNDIHNICRIEAPRSMLCVHTCKDIEGKLLRRYHLNKFPMKKKQPLLSVLICHISFLFDVCLQLWFFLSSHFCHIALIVVLLCDAFHTDTTQY